MAQSFKIKLQKLSDDEFSEILVNRDLFTGKKLMLLDQEARNRYFSNKEFNGENDVYINPEKTESVFEKVNTMMWVTSIAGVFLIAALFIVLTRNFFTEKPVELAVNETKAILPEQKSAQPDESGYFKPDKQNTVLPFGEVKTDASSLNEKQIANSQPSTLQPMTDLSIENQGNAESKKPVEVNLPIQNEIINKEPVSATSGKQDEEKKTSLPENSKQNPSISEINDNRNQIKNQAGSGSDEKRDQKKEQQSIQKESSPTETSKVVSETPYMFKISELSTEHLRQLVKFQNEWAHIQTTLKGVVDYYVDGNVAIKFILNQPYSDSVNQYQRRIIPILTGKYWKDLEKELGEKFPRTPMQISFVRFDSEL